MRTLTIAVAAAVLAERQDRRRLIEHGRDRGVDLLAVLEREVDFGHSLPRERQLDAHEDVRLRAVVTIVDIDATFDLLEHGVDTAL